MMLDQLDLQVGQPGTCAVSTLEELSFKGAIWKNSMPFLFFT